MTLFFEVLSCINNTHCQGTVQQLNDCVMQIRQLGNRHRLNLVQTEVVLTALSSPLRMSLRRLGAQRRPSAMEDMLAQFDQPFDQTVDQAIDQGYEPQCELIKSVIRQTGYSAKTIQAFVPKVLPWVIQLLRMGQSTLSQQTHNPLLEHFLEGREADLGKVFCLAHRFLGVAMD